MRSHYTGGIRPTVPRSAHLRKSQQFQKAARGLRYRHRIFLVRRPSPSEITVLSATLRKARLAREATNQAARGRPVGEPAPPDSSRASRSRDERRPRRHGTGTARYSHRAAWFNTVAWIRLIKRSQGPRSGCGRSERLVALMAIGVSRCASLPSIHFPGPDDDAVDVEAPARIFAKRSQATISPPSPMTSTAA